MVPSVTTRSTPATERAEGIAIGRPHEPFVVLGTGSQASAFLHVENAGDALAACMHHRPGQGLIQIGPEGCTSVRDLAFGMPAIAGLEIAPHFDTSRPESDYGRCADYTNASRVLGWQPRVPLREGLTRLYGWLPDRLPE